MNQNGDFVVNKQTRAFVWSAIAIAAISVSGCRGKTSGVIMTVDGEPITADEFSYQVERKPNVIVQTNSGQLQLPVAQPLGFQVANDLVNQKLLEKLAKEKGVYPTPAEVDAEIKYRNSKRKDYVIAQTNQGVTLEQIKRDIRLDLCQYKIVTKGVSVSDQEVESYIKANPKQFIVPKLVDIYWIVANNPKTISTINEELKSGKPFQKIAEKYSLERSARYPRRVFNELPARLRQIVDKVKEGGISGWEVDNKLKVRFYVDRIQPESKLKIEPWMKEEIKRSLAKAKGEKTVKLEKLLLDKRTKAKIEVSKPTLKEPFENLQKSLESQSAN